MKSCSNGLGHMTKMAARPIYGKNLDLYYAKVKFGHIGFLHVQKGNYVLFGNYCSHRPLSRFKHSNK